MTLAKYGSVIIVSSLLAVACSSSQPAEEGSASTDQALGETACGTNAITSSTVGTTITNPSFHCFWSDLVTSGSSYGSSGCENQFIVEVPLPFAPSAPRFSAGPATAISQADCPSFHETLGAYGHNASGWHNLGGFVGHGQWNVGGGIIAPYCEVITEADTIPTIANLTGYDKVRAVGSAWTVQLLKGSPFNSYVPVTAGLWGGNGC